MDRDERTEDAGPSARRAELLALARDAFFARGYDATSTRDLARGLGILGGSIYHHIDTKEELLFEIVCESFESGTALVGELRGAGGSSVGRLRRWIPGHVGAMATHTVAIGLLLHEASALSSEHRDEVARLDHGYVAAIVDVLDEGRRSGDLRGDLDPRLGAHHLLGAMNSMYRWYRPDGRLTSEAIGRECSVLLVDGLLVDGAAVGADGAASALADRVVAGSVAPRESDDVQQILDAAGELFARDGVVATSMQDIASVLGVRKAGLYRHIASKESLLYALVTRVTARMDSAIDLVSGASEADPIARLRALLEFQGSIVGDHRAETRLILHERRALSADHQRELLAAEHHFRRGLVALVREARDAGLVADDRDAGLAALCGLGSVQWMYRWYRPGGAATGRDLGRRLTDLLLVGLRG